MLLLARTVRPQQSLGSPSRCDSWHDKHQQNLCEPLVCQFTFRAFAALGFALPSLLGLSTCRGPTASLLQVGRSLRVPLCFARRLRKE